MKTNSRTEEIIEAIRMLLMQETNRSMNDTTFETVVEEYLNMMQHEKRQKSYCLYRTVSARFLKYMNGDFPLTELTPLHLQGFMVLLQRDGLSDTSIHIYLTLIRVLINYSIKMGYASYRVHPFVNVKMPTPAIREIDLTVEEMKRLRDVKLQKPHHQIARDVFMLTYYLGGINLQDLLAFNFRGQSCMHYVRKKTRHSKKGSNEIVFRIQPEAHLIIYKYMGGDGRLKFGRYDSYEKVYSLMFRHIGSIAVLAGIRHKVSYYSARKSFAQQGYELGLPIEQLEYCIGHSMKTNRPIFSYIRVMQAQADRIFRTILDQLL